MNERMITRDEAVETLIELAESGTLREDLADKLAEIASLIEHEREGMHYWGININDYYKMVTAYREDLITDKLMDDWERILEKYSFTPAPCEKQEIEEYIEEWK